MKTQRVSELSQLFFTKVDLPPEMSSQLRSASQDPPPKVKHSKNTRAHVGSVPCVSPRHRPSKGLRVEKVTLSKSSSTKELKNSFTFEEIFFEDQVGELTMDCSCIMNAGSGHLSGKMFITPTHLCFTSFSNPLGKKHKVIMRGDNIIAYKISEEKRRMNINALQKNTEKVMAYRFKKLDKEFLSMMIKWLQKFTCIDLSEKKNEGGSREHSTENTRAVYNSSGRNSLTQDIDSVEPIIRISNDFTHSESSIEETSNTYHQENVMTKVEEVSNQTDSENILTYIDNEIENFLALLETQIDPLYS